MSENSVFDEIAWSPRPNAFLDFSTVTYSISLYMIGAAEYSAIVESGTKDLTGAILFLQSGGISADSLGNYGAVRSEFFRDDLYMDDFAFEGYIAGATTQGAHNTMTFNFKVTEIGGLTFFNSLQQMSNAYDEKLGLTGRADSNYATQNYLAVIRFYGYDEEGNPVTIDKSSQPISDNRSDPSSISEKFIPFQFTRITFDLQTNNVAYNCECVCPQTLHGITSSRAKLPYNITVQGKTLQEMLTGENGLTTILNNYQKSLTPTQQKVADNYDIILDATKSELLDATMNVFGTQSSIITGSVDTPAPGIWHNDVYKQEFVAGTPITKMIETLINSSSYIVDQYSQSVNQTSGLITKKSDKREITWYKIMSQVNPLEVDTLRNEFAYDLSYYVTPFKAYIISPFNVDAVNQCPGVHKHYNYWFTGENTEIISFSQSLNYLWFMGDTIRKDGEVTEDTMNIGNLSITRRRPEITPGGVIQGSTNEANLATASIENSLYSPGDQAQVQIQIVGDPDFIAQSELFYSPKYLLDNNKHIQPFHDDGSVNFNASDINFAISFNTVEDYDLTTGLMKLKPNTSNTGGGADNSFLYKATTITSLFSGGRFTQQLRGALRSFPSSCSLSKPI